MVVSVSGAPAIKFHGMRHTCATLMLKAGQPVHVVSERLGHSKVSMTLEVYAHVLPDMQADAADALGEPCYSAADWSVQHPCNAALSVCENSRKTDSF